MYKIVEIEGFVSVTLVRNGLYFSGWGKDKDEAIARAESALENHDRTTISDMPYNLCDEVLVTSQFSKKFGEVTAIDFDRGSVTVTLNRIDDV